MHSPSSREMTAKIGDGMVPEKPAGRIPGIRGASGSAGTVELTATCALRQNNPGLGEMDRLWIT
jgi:hypothetical protein